MASKDPGIYYLIKLFERPIVMDWSLLAVAFSFWSSMTNTMNLRFGMMTPTVLDMAALFGLSPIGVEDGAEDEYITPLARLSMRRSCYIGYASSSSVVRRTR
jgi:hypothetical protein